MSENKYVQSEISDALEPFQQRTVARDDTKLKVFHGIFCRNNKYNSFSRFYNRNYSAEPHEAAE